ncbi:cell wall hydrolase [Altererythrobacter sp. KTW20L]|uniref:cell wall hydrolase n=1 Tax=Altererythrobacter sp. KTW20L TaxID=2942210 RepID=UPI0020BF9436|nr:cell wall hydrolase [Altererythrobacter sp. KTW20L]MCL6249965.1 cell wall hydrolase [Altererythrobacter sp. KTW20L]
MIRKTLRAGAFASAALMIAIVSGTGLTGAIAQDQTQADQPAAVPTQPVVEAPEMVRFVSEPVVQDISAPEAQPGPTAETLHALVATFPAGDALSPELTCLAQAVYFEARGEPLGGQLAVARVVINRTDSNQFPDDYCSVVTQRSQFSFVRNGRIPQPNTSSTAWQRARAIARIAHQDLWASEVDDSLFFHATHVRPSWAGRKASVARIDSHIFYR